jgi:hypothetical protein
METQDQTRRFLYRIPPHDAPPDLPDGVFLVGSHDVRVFEAYRPVSVIPTALLRGGDDCCKKHPERPTVSLTVEFDGLSIKATVNASHPCGIKHITAFVADKKLELMPPFSTPVEVYPGKFVNGHFIDDSADNNAAGPATRTFTLPAGDLIDELFYVAAVATSTCDTTAGDNKGGWILV